MLYRDIVERKKIKTVAALKFFLKRLFASATKPMSVHKIFNELKSAGFKIGKNQLYEYLAAAENSYMYKNGFECDFIVAPGNKGMQAIQVCYDVAAEHWLLN